MTSPPNGAPSLDRPGAGVPRIEMLIGGAIVRTRRLLGSRRGTDRAFSRERLAMRDLFTPLPPDECSRRVLIPRLRGLEDSSRYWSVWMTLDHLRIVNSQIAQLIQSLCRGVVPPGEASTAAVKPSADVNAQVVEDYEASCDALLSATAKPPTLRTRTRYAHPWFGLLDAAGWHTMAGMHMAIHRRQIEAIVRGLPRRTEV